MDSMGKPVRRISRRLFRLTIAVSLLLTLALAAIQAVIDYRMRLASIAQVMEQVKDVQLANLTTALWSYDKDNLTTQANGILHYPYLRHVAVFDKNTIIAESGSPAAQRSFSMDFPLVHSLNGVSQEIGVLQ